DADLLGLAALPGARPDEAADLKSPDPVGRDRRRRWQSLTDGLADVRPHGVPLPPPSIPCHLFLLVVPRQRAPAPALHWGEGGTRHALGIGVVSEAFSMAATWIARKVEGRGMTGRVGAVQRAWTVNGFVFAPHGSSGASFAVAGKHGRLQHP